MDAVIERPAPAARRTPDNDFDEAFLRRVDQATHERKLRDPLRLDQVHRAANEELRHNRGLP
ncbi:hypothetical protein J7E62_24595 [Variovorax paradoxus]|nr:hypothetical protein [Variovorax paradoxus]